MLSLSVFVLVTCLTSDRPHIGISDARQKLCTTATGSAPAAGGSDRAADAASAGSQTPGTAKGPAARSGAGTPVPTLVAPAGSKPVAPAAPAPALMDLLSLEDGPPTAAPAAAAQGGAQAPAATDDGEGCFIQDPRLCCIAHKASWAAAAAAEDDCVHHLCTGACCDR